jgi:hypothetical protein
MSVALYVAEPSDLSFIGEAECREAKQPQNLRKML